MTLKTKTAQRHSTFISERSNDRPAWCAAFTKLSRPPRRRNLAVFDIETADATLLGPAGGIAFTSDADAPRVLTFGNHSRASCMIHFLRHFLQLKYRGFVAYAHNGMSFDLAHIFGSNDVQQWIMKQGYTVTVDRSFAVVQKHKHSWYFGDSMRFVQESLEKILVSFAPHITKTPLPKTKFSWHSAEWKARITNDTLGLYESLKKLESVMMEAFGVPLSLTMPSTALKAARLMLPLEKVKRPSRKALDWLRAGAYSGGRIEALYQGHADGHILVFDVNSAYAWALRQPLPIGPGRFTRREPSSYWLARCRIGINTDEKYPPVLSRLYHHKFPVGTFEAFLTSDDAAFIRANTGNVDFVEGFAWKNSFPVFENFINTCERLRKQDYNGPLGKAVKLAQNGLYGILGMNAFRKVQALSEQTLPFPWVHAFDTTTGVYLPNTYEATMYRESPNQMPHWAAIITSRVRLRLTTYLYECVKANLKPLYVHTDSIWTLSQNGIPPTVQQLVSTEYGALKVECEGSHAIVIAPGEGAIETATGWKIASKGWKTKDDEGKDTTADTMMNATPTQIPQTQVFRAGTALKRKIPGRITNKLICSYDAMRNRLPPHYRPGITRPHVAEAFDYAYWSYRAWYVGKLLHDPPSKERARGPLQNRAPALPRTHGRRLAAREQTRR